MRQMAQLQGQLRGVNSGFSGAAGGANQFENAIGRSSAARFGSQMQWLGRQLSYNFTMPLVAAGTAALQWELANEKAMARVEKVYGDGSQSAQQMKHELESLGKAFEALSNQFGVAQSDVINIAADWAAAGSSGIALAKAVKLTLETMVLGELEAAKATEALIAIQAQYGQNTSELTKTIATLNMIENQTGVSMKDLIDAFSRSAGVARAAGVDVRHLGGMIAAMVPTAGSASQAGNALKTMISRLLGPTKEAKEVLALMNIETSDMAWKSATANDRLMILAKSFEKLSDAQKAVVSSVLASRFQINKFEVLIKDMASGVGRYATALRVTADDQAVFNQMSRELRTVLTSNPKRLEVIWTMLKNASADVIQPMIPLILALASSIQNAVTWFSNLNPGVQKAILLLLALLAAVGPIVIYLGAFRVMLAELGTFFKFLVGPIGAASKAIKEFASKINIGGALSKMGQAMVGFWTRMAAGWAAFGGFVVRGMVAASLGALSAFVWLGRAMSAALVGIGQLYATWMLGIQRMTAVGGQVIRATWLAIMIGVHRVIAVAGPALATVWGVVMWGVTQVTLAWSRGLPAIFAAAMVAARNTVLAGAFAIGVIWRTATLAWSTILVSFSFAVARIMAVVNTTIAAGTALLGRWVALGLMGMWAAMKAIGPGLIAGARALGTAITVAFSGPWGWAIAGIILAFIMFHKQLKQIWTNVVNWFRSSGPQIATAFAPVVRMFDAAKALIIRAFNALPQGVQNALMAVVRTVRAAAVAVYEGFQWMNPWARHSPSLVDNVTSGVAEIIKQYNSLGDIGSIFANAGMDLRTFGAAIAKIQAISEAAQFAQMGTDLGKIAGSSVPQFQALLSLLGPLRDRLLQIQLIMVAQESVVDDLKGKLDAVNAAYDQQNAILDRLRTNAQAVGDQLEAAKTSLDNFANAPIAGMKAMGDLIFANGMEQKRLQLQMMKMEDAVGPLDKLQGRLDSIHGQMELLRGEQTNLRNGGAGSEITAPYDAMLSSLEEQQKAIGDQIRPIKDLSDQLDELGRKGQMLDLENSLKFDPLKRQIDDVAHSMQELPFDQIIAGVTQSRAQVDQYTAALNAANAAVTAQQAVVDQAKAARDALQASYDTENSKLQALKDAYQSVDDTVGKVTGSLHDMHSAAQAAAQAAKDTADSMSPGAQNFIDAAGGNFPDPGGKFQVGREEGGLDQSAMIEDFTKDLAKQTKDMFGLFSFMEPIKKKWNEAIAWLKENVGPMFSTVGDGIKAAFDNMPNPFDSGIGKSLKNIANDAKGWLEPLKKLWDDVFGPEIKGIIENTLKAIKDAFGKVWPEIQKFKDLAEPLGKLLTNVWDNLKPVLGVVLGLIGAVLSGLLGAIKEGIGPFIKMIGDIIAGIIRVIRGIIEFVVGVFTGDWELAWKGLVDIVGGVWDTIWGIIQGVVYTIAGIIEGFVKGIVDFFKWLYDVLVGHSIVPDLVDKMVAIFNWFVDTAKKIWNGLWDGIKWVFDQITSGWNKFWAAFKSVFETVGKAIFDAVMSAWNGVQSFFKKAWEGLQSMWDGVLRGMGWVYDNILKPVFDRLVSAIGWAKTAFSQAVDGIRIIWDALKEAASAPIRFVVNTVIGDKLVGGWNWISDNVLGGKFRINNFPRFAGGGHVKGEGGPRQDNIWARLSNGEYVIPANIVKKMGVGFFDWMIGRPTSKKPGDGSEGLAFGFGGLVGDIWDAIKDPGSILKKFVNPVIGKIPGAGRLTDMAGGFVGSLMDKMISKAKSLVGGEDGNAAQAKAWLHGQAGKPYVWASAGPHGYDCSGIVSAVWNILKGRNPYNHTFSTYDEANYFPKSGFGQFTAGWANPGEKGGGSVGHTAAMIGGLQFESRGGDGVVIGNGATPVTAFAHIGHYDNGGWMNPGFGLHFNGLRKPEAVLTNQQWGYIERMVDGKSSDPQATARSTTYNEIHFHGDLSFPNVRDGRDADDFIKNLESLVRGA